MARLPRYDSKLEMSTQSPRVLRNMEAEGQAGRDIATLGKAASQIAAAWQKADDFKTQLENKNRLDGFNVDILQRASKDPDHTNKQSYVDDLMKTKDGISGFTNNQARMEFEAYADSVIAQSTIKLDGLYNKKNLDWTDANILTQGQLNHGSYIAGETTADGKDPKVAQAELIERGWADGISSKVDTVKRLDALKSWGYDKGIYDAQNGRFKGVDAYDVEDGKKDNLLREVKQIAEMKAKANDIAHLEMQYGNQQKFIEDQEKGMSISESLERLDYAVDTKTMDESWAKSRRAAILSTAGIDPNMQIDYYYSVVQRINRANAKYNLSIRKGKSARNYVKEGNAALIDINNGLAKGLLDKGDERELLKRIYTKEMSKAEVDAGKDLRLATEELEKQLTPAEIPYGIKSYIEEKDKTGGKRVDILSNVIREVKNESRNRALKLQQDIIAREQVELGTERVDQNGVRYKKVEGGWQKIK